MRKNLRRKNSIHCRYGFAKFSVFDAEEFSSKTKSGDDEKKENGDQGKLARLRIKLISRVIDETRFAFNILI